jgi:hypothetical protein
MTGGMDRRRFGLSAAALAAAGLAPGLARAAAAPLRDAAREMALYGLPLIEIATTRARSARAGAPTNRFQHGRALVTPKTQAVTAPNNDTLYSSAWVDLSQGPVKITLPPAGERYFCLQLMDAWTSSFAVLGTRNSGPAGDTVMLVGPNDPLPPGEAIRSSTPWVWALGRTLVNGEADLPAAHAFQDGLKLEGPPGRKAQAFAGRDAAWPDYFAAVQALIVEARPSAVDHAIFVRCAALGVGPTGGFDAKRFSAAEGAEIAAGLAEALNAAKDTANGSQPVGRWIYPKFDLGVWGQDYRYRAQIALSGLAALPVDEALYARPMGPTGKDQLDGAAAWRLRFPKGDEPPVDAFWSLTAYAVTPAGQAFLMDNPINRYAIGDRTPGLVRGSDGSLEILISPKDPGGGRRANWLPSPTAGRPLILSMRAYLPRAQMLNGRYQFPPLTLVHGKT